MQRISSIRQKLQIIGDNIQNADEIYNIVNNIAVQNGVTLTQDELDTICFPSAADRTAEL